MKLNAAVPSPPNVAVVPSVIGDVTLYVSPSASPRVRDQVDCRPVAPFGTNCNPVAMLAGASRC